MIKRVGTCHIFLILFLLIHVQLADGQVAVIDPPALGKNASYNETLSWLNQYWFPNVGIGVDDRNDPDNGKTNTAFFKGFKLLSSDNCVLFFKNEGNFKEAVKTPYLVEATVPLINLNAESSKVRGRKPFGPSIDEGYGLWDARFASKKYDLDIVLNFKTPDNKSFRGSIVEFTLPTQKNAIQFSKAFLRLSKTCKVK